MLDSKVLSHLISLNFFSFRFFFFFLILFPISVCYYATFIYSLIFKGTLLFYPLVITYYIIIQLQYPHSLEQLLFNVHIFYVGEISTCLCKILWSSMYGISLIGIIY